jgi:hypothetical protein
LEKDANFDHSSSWRTIRVLLPEKGVPTDSLPPSNDAFSGVTGSASRRAQHTGIQGLDEEGASCDDDDPDD